MTILAQLWLEEHRKTKFDFWLAQRLRLPMTGQDKEGAEHTAERVVFSETLSDVLADLIDTKQLDTDIILSTVRMPADAVWIEWPHFDIRMGMLLDQAPSGRVAVTVVAGKKHKMSGIIYAGTIDELPMPKGTRAVQLGFSTLGPVNAKETQDYFGCTVVEALCGLFLLQQPKVVSVEEIEHGPKLQRARAKRGKLPLLEYRRVQIKIGTIAKRSNASASRVDSDDAAGRRRYHRVLGHFRVYGRETPDPHALWIEPYFRGDPSLGIVLHERTLA